MVNKLFKKFEELAEKKHEVLKKAGLTCICGKCNLANFRLDEVKKILEENENVD